MRSCSKVINTRLDNSHQLTAKTIQMKSQHCSYSRIPVNAIQPSTLGLPLTAKLPSMPAFPTVFRLRAGYKTKAEDR